MLTLPNGERLKVSPNLRFIVECLDLKTATMATISRCGLVIINDKESFSCEELFTTLAGQGLSIRNPQQKQLFLAHFASSRGKLVEILQNSQSSCKDVIKHSVISKIATFFALVSGVLNENTSILGGEKYYKKLIFYAFFFAFFGNQVTFHQELLASKYFPEEHSQITRIYPCPNDQGCLELTDLIPSTFPGITGTSAKKNSLLIQTENVIKHKRLVSLLLTQRKDFILCGPAGSGKTMMVQEIL